jgi:AraC-like DNA-binding protein
MRTSRPEIGTDVSGPTCIYARVRVRLGQLRYRCGDALIEAPRRFDLFIPPFCVVQALLDDCDVVTSGLAFRPAAGGTLPAGPQLWASNAGPFPRSGGEALGGLAGAVQPMAIGRCARPSRLAAAIKELIDATYMTSLRIDDVARRARTSAAASSRSFGRAFGLPPVSYRHRLRIIDALTRLAAGAAPIDVCHAVGFADLGRFYKVFRAIACATPGTCRARAVK